jgi:hypothetical protein
LLNFSVVAKKRKSLISLLNFTDSAQRSVTDDLSRRLTVNRSFEQGMSRTINIGEFPGEAKAPSKNVNSDYSRNNEELNGRNEQCLQIKQEGHTQADQ